MKIQSVSIKSGLNLVSMEIEALSAPIVAPSVNRIFICDVSASMSGDLSLLRRHLKGRMDLVVSREDTVTIGYFSGRGQFGLICEGAKIHNIADRAIINSAIDRKLVPMGMTGFKEPLEEVKRVITRLKSLDKNSAFSLVFMSDGHDNQWAVSEIMKAVNDIADDIASSTIVEYGWYANRPLLTRMSEALGGQYIHVENGERFLPVLDAGMSNRVSGINRREVTLPYTPLHNLVFSLSDDGLMVWNADNNKIRVPSDQKYVYFLSDDKSIKGKGKVDPKDLSDNLIQGLYCAVASLSQRMLSDDVLSVLSVLGDVRLINKFASCFGKQQYSSFREDAISASLNANNRWEDGYDANAIPPDNAYTVLQLLSDLSVEGNMLHTDDAGWDYSSIGRKTSFGGDKIDDESLVKLSEAILDASNISDLDAIKSAVEAIQNASVKEYKFTRTNEDGVPMTNLVMNESRPNISIQTKQNGFLELGSDGLDHNLPERLPAHIYRNYAVVRDGIMNVKILPVSLTHDTYIVLEKHGVISGGWVNGKVYHLNIDALPIINRHMVKSAVVGARDMFALEWQLIKAKAAQKVFKYYEEQYAPRSRVSGLEKKYGVENSEWLKSIGLTDGGFSPKRVVDEVSDVYVGRELKVTIKGFSSLAKVSDVEERLAKGGKLTGPMILLAPFVEEVTKFIENNKDVIENGNVDIITMYLQTMTKSWISEVRRINSKLSEIKFAVIVGQVWFSEFASLDEGSLDMVDNNGNTYFATAQLKDIDVKI